MWIMPFLVMIGLPTLAFASTNGDYHGPGMMWGGSWGGMFMGPLIMIAFIAVIVAVVILLMRWLGGVGRNENGFSTTPQGKAAIEILKERYARGEIDKTEFEERRRTLSD